MNAPATIATTPDGWVTKRLLDMCMFIPGKAHEPFIDLLGEYVCVNSKFISTEGKVAKTCNNNITPARRDDILLVMSDLPNGRALAKCFLVDEDDRLAVNQRVCILRPRQGYDAKMLFHILNRNPYFLAFDDGVNQTHLLNSVFESCALPVPENLEEQARLGEALSDADGVIEGLERLIAKKRRIKQGALQDLLTAKRRLPGFSGEWEEKRLGQVFSIGSSKRVFQSDWQNNGVPFFRAREIVAFHERRKVEDGLFISQKLYEDFKDKHGIPQVGDLLVTGVGTLGRVFLVRDERPFYFKDGNIIWFKVRGSMSSEFLAQLFLFEPTLEQIHGSAGGSTVGTYTISGAKKTLISFPEIKEQEAIAELLDDMDAEIRSLEVRLEKARAIKEGMMQNLLTGRLRLV